MARVGLALAAFAWLLVSWNVLFSLDDIEDPFASLRGYCDHVPPISNQEFVNRQASLARTLHSLNASAYIAEPGASAQFFGNLSLAQWGLSERPLLLIVSPELDERGALRPKVSVLTPAFEATRAKLLVIPSEFGVTYAEWPEDADPYAVAVKTILPSLAKAPGKIYVDGMVRTFVADGLRTAAPGSTVESAPEDIRQLRERKSAAELTILKCVNEATVSAVRETRKQLYIGVRESQARALIRKALSAAGLTEIDSLVLFGENAALPHGTGTDRILGKSDFVLFDCGGSLHGYFSDVTRTFALPSSEISDRHLDLWHLVHRAQSEAIGTAHNGTLTRTVDAAARRVITEAGYGKYFNHRLGHGIGLEVHEQPYIRGGSEDIIQTGHSFSDEPGIYIEGEVGVRLEDCFYIDEDGEGVFLTAGVGGQAKSPWDP